MQTSLGTIILPTIVVLDKIKMLIKVRGGVTYYKIKSFCFTKETIPGSVSPRMVLRLGMCPPQLVGKVSLIPVQ